MIQVTTTEKPGCDAPGEKRASREVQLFVPLLTEEAMATMRANCQSNQDHWAALLEKHGKQTAGELVTAGASFGVCSTDVRPQRAHSRGGGRKEYNPFIFEPCILAKREQ